MQTVPLGHSSLHVTPICLGTMTFGEQVDEATAFSIMDRAVERGINFLDTAEMYAVPPRAETFNATERIIGNWLAKKSSGRSTNASVRIRPGRMTFERTPRAANSTASRFLSTP